MAGAPACPHFKRESPAAQTTLRPRHSGHLATFSLPFRKWAGSRPALPPGEGGQTPLPPPPGDWKDRGHPLSPCGEAGTVCPAGSRGASGDRQGHPVHVSFQREPLGGRRVFPLWVAPAEGSSRDVTAPHTHRGHGHQHLEGSQPPLCTPYVFSIHLVLTITQRHRDKRFFSFFVSGETGRSGPPGW